MLLTMNLNVMLTPTGVYDAKKVISLHPVAAVMMAMYKCTANA